ncbi:MAG: sulfatase-like hydrolase/transferase [Planctomycetaceae bacterium]
MLTTAFRWRTNVRQLFRIKLGLILLGLLALAGGRDAVAASPNILLIFVDDMGWADFSCFGNKNVQTERIDRLAREGIRYEQFYVNSPICSPSRVAISTGQYPQRWRITSYLNNRQSNIDRGMAQWLDPKAPLLARLLQQAGYATGHFGKWHMGGQRDVGDAPLISEYGFDASLTNFEGLGPRLLPLLDSHDGSPVRKHSLGSDQLGRGEIQWMDRGEITGGFVARALNFAKQSHADGKPFYINLWPDDVHSPFFPAATRRGDRSKQALYNGVLKSMDEQLTPLLDYIAMTESLRDNTLVLICSDNGPEPGAGSAGMFRGQKTMLYEGGIRSPLIVWGPGLQQANAIGSVNRTSLFSAIDLVPSLLAIAGVPTPDGMSFDGESLPGVLLGREQVSRLAPLCFRRPPDRDSFYGVNDLPDLAIRDGQWKLLCEYDGSNPELYNLDTDPSETNNQTQSHPAITQRLTQTLLDWHRAMPEDRGATYQLPSPKKRP